MGIPIIGDIIKTGGDLLGKTIKDKDKQMELESGLVAKQIDVNNTEASSGSLFVAGWRPAVGWISAASLGYSAILYPTMQFIAKLSGYTGGFPVLDDTITMQILFGMLGIGAMRSYEKAKGVSTNDYTDVPKPREDTKKAPEPPREEGVPEPKKRKKFHL